MAAIDERLAAVERGQVKIETKVDGIAQAITDLVALYRRDHDDLTKIISRVEVACSDIESIRSFRDLDADMAQEDRTEIVMIKTKVDKNKDEIEKIKNEKTENKKSLSSKIWNIITMFFTAVLALAGACILWKIKGA